MFNSQKKMPEGSILAGILALLIFLAAIISLLSQLPPGLPEPLQTWANDSTMELLAASVTIVLLIGAVVAIFGLVQVVRGRKKPSQTDQGQVGSDLIAAITNRQRRPATTGPVMLRVLLLLYVLSASLLSAIWFFIYPELGSTPLWLDLASWTSWLLAMAAVVLLALALVGFRLTEPGTGPASRYGMERNQRALLLGTWLLLLLVVVLAWIIAANEMGMLVHAKNALQRKTALFLILFLAIFGVYPLTYLAYRTFGEKTHRERLEEHFLLLGLADTSTVKGVVDELYSTVHSSFQYIVYLLLIGLITVLVLYAYVSLGITAGDEESAGALTPVQASSIFFAFLGAYVFSVQELVRRYSTYDLQPQVYASIVVRMLIAIGIVYVALLVLQDGATTEDRGIWAATAFLIGIFPTQGIQLLTQAATKALANKAPEHSLLPLRNLPGISPWHESRLLQMGIDDARNLADADLGRLLLTTQFDAQQIVSWVDQAILYAKVGDARFKELRDKGIRGNHQLTQAFAPENGRAAPEVVVAVRECLDKLNALESDQDQINQGIKDMLQRIVEGQAPGMDEDLKDIVRQPMLVYSADFPNAQRVAGYYDALPQVIRRHYHNSLRSSLLADALSALDHLAFEVSALGELKGIPLDRKQRDELEELLETLALMLKYDRTADLLCKRGAGRAFLGETEEAERDFGEAIAARPRSAAAHASRAMLRLGQGNIQPALADANNAVRLDPVSATVRYNRGLVLLMANRIDEAKADFGCVIDKSPSHGLAHMHFAITQLLQGDFASAEDASDRAQMLGIEWPELVAVRGLATANDQGTRRARQDLSTAMERMPQVRPELLLARGLMYSRSGDTESADADWELASLLADDPIRREWITLRIAAAQLAESNQNNDPRKDDERAIKSLRDLVGRRPDALNARVFLATLLERQGDKATAKEHYDAVNNKFEGGDPGAPERYREAKEFARRGAERCAKA